MIVFLNGELLPEAEAKVSVFDRGFLYGDGLFETMRVHRGKPFRWAEHLERLQRGAEFLKIGSPFTTADLREQAAQLIARNGMPESLLRVTLSRGCGERGYSPRDAKHPTLAMTLHSAPDSVKQPPPEWRVITSSIRLPVNDPLAQFKTCNKLPQILARAEADAQGADEALLLNTDGEVVEGSASNLFWIRDGMVCTPPVASGILPGVTRKLVLEICGKLGLPARENGITPDELTQAEGIFLTLSSRGVMEAIALNGQPLEKSASTKTLQAACVEAIRSECG